MTRSEQHTGPVVTHDGGRQSQADATAPRPNIIKGMIEVGGTNAGVGSLVVRVYDVVAVGAGQPPLRQPLGSTLTHDGSFELRYEDEQFAARRADGSRPDLLVAIFAPETGPDGDAGVPILETAPRTSAAREECFLIHVDLADLSKRGVLLPALMGAAVGDPETVGIAAEVERTRQARIRDQLTDVRRKAVAEARRLDSEMETELRDRLLQHLTGVTPRMPQWRRFVAPGKDVQAVVRAHQQEAIKTTINGQAGGPGTVTYLVLTDEERDALGNPPDPAEVERLLRRRNPTSTLLREDPMALACLRRQEASPFDPPQDPPPGPPPADPLDLSADVDAKVAQLVESIRSPEDLTLGGLPDQETVSANVKQLRLSKGPADVPAFYDFNNLQLAFDHVWEDARAEGYIERAKSLYRYAADQGGDPRSALAATRDPLRALAREVQVVREAQARFTEPGLSFTPATASNGTGAPGVIYMRPQRYLDLGGGPLGPKWPGQPLPPEPPDPIPPPRPGVIVDPIPEQPPGDGGAPSPYPFTVFAANSINFGLLVTYRQCWDPTFYQVGRLVGTRTLAPKETITLTTRQMVKTSFNQKQVESSQQERSMESSVTQRDEAEIVARAQTKTNFALTTQGGYDLGPLGEGTATTAFGRDSDSNSQETKRAVREAASKEAQKYRDERQMTVETGTSSETETTEKRELSNPNDELALTYVFYELQRRYRVSERLHRAMPVVLVAQRVPRPEEITEAWVTRHDWIIRRFLPDDSFRTALTYLSTRATGDRIVLDELRRQMDTVRGVVESLRVEIGIVRNEAAAQLEALQGYVERKAAIEREEDSSSAFGSAWAWVAGADEESRDAIRVLEEATRERYEKAAREERDLRARLDRESTALQAATEAYTKAHADYSNQRLQVNRLIRHIADFILHYMQGIWSYEHPDQQFFRHHTLTAPRLEALTRHYELTVLPDWPLGTVPQPDKRCFQVTFTTTIDPDLDSDDRKATLAELADLDRPLGYKGNYIIYPLKASNALTDFMLTPYLDAELGLRDPDGAGNWTLQEFSQYVQCLRERLSPEAFAKVEPTLTRHYQELLADPLRDGEEIVVPTQSLYMQMLVDPGKALEEFKAAHRLMDVMTVKGNVRAAELNNLRLAKLVLDDQLEDPNIESVKNVYYRGSEPPHDGDE